jgi:hypothetical protein
MPVLKAEEMLGARLEEILPGREAESPDAKAGETTPFRLPGNDCWSAEPI